MYANFAKHDLEWQNKVREMLQNKDLSELPAKMQEREDQVKEKLLLLFFRHLVDLREKWSAETQEAYQVGDVCYLLDSFQTWNHRHKIGIIEKLDISRDGTSRNAVLRVQVKTSKSRPGNPVYRPMQLARSLDMLSAPLVRGDSRNLLKSEFHDLSAFWKSYGRF